MDENSRTLRKHLARLRRREIAVRWVAWSGRLFLAAASLSLLLVLVRRFLLDTRGLDILPLSPLEFVFAAVGVVLLPPVLARICLRIRRPALESTAKFADGRLDLRDLLASGLAAGRLTGPVPEEVVRRAAVAAGRSDPATLYPARRRVAKTIGKFMLLLAALYLLGLPGGAGWIPVPGGDGGGELPGLETAGSSGEDAEEEGVRRDGEAVETTERRDDEEEEPSDVPDRILARVLPSKKVYEAGEPVLVFVTAAPGEPMKRTHALEAMLAVDGEVAALDETLTVRPGDTGGAVHMVEDARKVPGLGERLTPGKHFLSAALVEGGEAYLSEPVEIEIRGTSDGGGGGGEPQAEPEPEPEPQAGGEPPPPPEFEGIPRFVTPLFGEGETVKKEGLALVPDPDAPAGSPPRRLPLDQAASEAARRPESPVRTERLSPADREAVVRYFDHLRGQ